MNKPNVPVVIGHFGINLPLRKIFLEICIELGFNKGILSKIDKNQILSFLENNFNYQNCEYFYLSPKYNEISWGLRYWNDGNFEDITIKDFFKKYNQPNNKSKSIKFSNLKNFSIETEILVNYV